jgi:hypothetical protein
VTVTTLSDAEKQAFARATRPVFDKWAQTVGADLVRRAEGGDPRRAGLTPAACQPSSTRPRSDRTRGRASR